jgi:hypothetical protein
MICSSVKREGRTLLKSGGGSGSQVISLLGVPEEQALAMVLVVEAANLLSVAGIGAVALWSQGVAISDMRAEAASRRG